MRINYYPPRGDNKEGWDNIDIVGWMGYPMQIKVNFLCRDSILAAPIVLDLALFFDFAQRAGLKGIQEWLSFYFKSPMTAPGLQPEHDLFIQQTKLKNTLAASDGRGADHASRAGVLRMRSASGQQSRRVSARCSARVFARSAAWRSCGGADRRSELPART